MFWEIQKEKRSIKFEQNTSIRGRENHSKETKETKIKNAKQLKSSPSMTTVNRNRLSAIKKLTSLILSQIRKFNLAVWKRQSCF